ncbi:MAG: glycosyltransferase family 2 protein [Phyllobacterium sp.]
MEEGLRGSKEKYDFTVTIVIFRPHRPMLLKTLASLRQALQLTGSLKTKLFIIDNTPGSFDYDWLIDALAGFPSEIIAGQGNIGFGKANNIVTNNVGTLHLVLNPDVEMEPEALVEALNFMADNPNCGLLTPKAFNADGTNQYLCKRYPAVLDLLLRGFAPDWVKGLFSARLRRYEMRDQINDAVVWDPPIVSGCFMFFRGEVFQKLNGFDPRYKLYFEDFDISLRTAKLARIAYVPAVKIVHEGGSTARKGYWHIWQFTRSASKFFWTHPLKLI